MHDTGQLGFNEAAAYNCGNPGVNGIAPLRRPRFNEAAAYNCGNLANVPELGYPPPVGLQ